MQTRREPRQDALPQCGIITSVDNSSYRAKVYLPLLDIETDYIRAPSLYVGAGWGLKTKLHAGNEVLVIFPNGDLNNGLITSVYFSEEADPAPGDDDFALVHESGSVLSFSGGDITIMAKGALTLKGATVNLN